MKTFFQVIFLATLIAVGTTACLSDSITGAIKADTNNGNFNSLVSTGVLTKFNNVLTKNLVITGTNGTKVVTLTISEVGGDTLTNCLSVGTYTFDNATSNAQLIYATGTNAYTNIIDCTVEITACDEAENAITGTFKGTVASSVAGDTLSFTNGTFEDVVFQN